MASANAASLMTTVVLPHLSLTKACHSKDASGRYPREAVPETDFWSASIPLEEADPGALANVRAHVVYQLSFVRDGGMQEFYGSMRNLLAGAAEDEEHLHNALLAGGAVIRFAVSGFAAAVVEKARLARPLFNRDGDAPRWSDHVIFTFPEYEELALGLPAGPAAVEVSAGMPDGRDLPLCIFVTGDLSTIVHQLTAGADSARDMALLEAVQGPGFELRLRYKQFPVKAAAEALKDQLLRSFNYAFNDQGDGQFRHFVEGSCCVPLRFPMPMGRWMWGALEGPAPAAGDPGRAPLAVAQMAARLDNLDERVEALESGGWLAPIACSALMLCAGYALCSHRSARE